MDRHPFKLSILALYGTGIDLIDNLGDTLLNLLFVVELSCYFLLSDVDLSLESLGLRLEFILSDLVFPGFLLGIVDLASVEVDNAL